MQKRPSVIGIYSGAPQSGKSTVAKILKYSYGYVSVKFAAPLKAMTTAFLYDLGMKPEIIQECLEGNLKETKLDEVVLGDLTPRKIMQTLGTEWGRNTITDNLWIKIASAKIQRLLEAGHGVVVDDLRFVNEYGMLRYIPNSMLFRVVRPGAQSTYPHLSEGLLDHAQFDHTLHNIGGLDELVDRVHNVMAGYHSNDPKLDQQLDEMNQKLK